VTPRGARSRVPGPLQAIPPLIRHCVTHPGDAPVVLSASWYLRRKSWWRHAPFLPLPGPKYWQFRMVTVNGSDQTALSAKEIVAAAKWAKAQRTSR
jgi:hypothetical protein